MEGREKSLSSIGAAYAGQIASTAVGNRHRCLSGSILLDVCCLLCVEEDVSAGRSISKYRLFLLLCGICIVLGLFTNVVVTLMFI